MTQTVLMIAVVAVGVLTCGLGLAYRQTLRQLSRLPADGPEVARTVDVIVPARNEARDVVPAVESLLAQATAHVRVLLVNDGSTDGTRELVDALAARYPQVEVFHDPALRPGWFGKVNAMQTALSRATADYVLFTDADVRHRSRALARGLAELEQEGLDFLSFCPRFDFACWWENVLLPHATITGAVRFLSPGRGAAAVGAFMLVRRSVLEKVGGLACVKNEMLDDVMLARRIQQSGFRTGFYLAPTLCQVRLFKTNRDAFWGLTKNVLAGLTRPWQALPLAAYVVLIYGVPSAALLIGIFSGNGPLVASAVAVYGLQLSLVCLVRPLAVVRWSQAWAFPLAVIPLLCCLGAALHYRYRFGGVYWRGRVVSVEHDEERAATSCE